MWEIDLVLTAIQFETGKKNYIDIRIFFFLLCLLINIFNLFIQYTADAKLFNNHIQFHKTVQLLKCSKNDHHKEERDIV